MPKFNVHSFLSNSFPLILAVISYISVYMTANKKVYLKLLATKLSYTRPGQGRVGITTGKLASLITVKIPTLVSPLQSIENRVVHKALSTR